MPDPLDMPQSDWDDLISLQRAAYAADAAITGRIAACPQSSHAWSEGQQQAMDRLREARRQAGEALRTHPRMAEALAAGCFYQTSQRVKDLTLGRE